VCVWLCLCLCLCMSDKVSTWLLGTARSATTEHVHTAVPRAQLGNTVQDVVNDMELVCQALLFE